MSRIAVPFLVLAVSCAVPARRSSIDFWSVARMEEDLQFLASDAMKGRNNATPEGTAAADYIAERLKRAGLRPAGENGTWFQTIPGRQGDRGRNVIGALPGTTPEWIVLGAHYDGLGERDGKIFNGADDNASGVAMLLEIARFLPGPSYRRGFLFCFFDAEEDGLVGSTHFVKSDLYPVSSFSAMICLDLIGGAFFPGDERRVFALGSECSESLFERIGLARAAGGRLEVERAGIYAIEPMGPAIARSDYSPFRMKKVPFVFFSTGTPWYYHTPDDDIERVDLPKMWAIAELVNTLAYDLAVQEHRPEWREPAPNVAEDARLMAAACRRILEHPAIRASDRQRAAVADAMEALQRSPDKGAVQRAMMVLFSLAAAQRPAH